MSHRIAIQRLPRKLDAALRKCIWVLPAVALQIGCSGAEGVDADPSALETEDDLEPGTDSRPEADEIAGADVESEAADPEAPIDTHSPSSEPAEGSDAEGDEIGTLGQPLAPLCAVPTTTSGGGITVNNFCGVDVRIRVIWGFAPDSECIHLFVDDNHHFNRPHSGARFDGLDDC